MNENLIKIESDAMIKNKLKVKDIERDVKLDVQIACKFVHSDWFSSKVTTLIMSVGEPTQVEIRNVSQTDKGGLCLNLRQSMQSPSELISMLNKQGVNEFIDLKMKASNKKDAQEILFKWFFTTISQRKLCLKVIYENPSLVS